MYKILFGAVFLGYNQYRLGGFMVFVVLCPGAPEGSPAVVLVLKRLRRWGHDLKSHPTDWEKPGIEPATPGLKRHMFIPYTTAASIYCHFGKEQCSNILLQIKVYDLFNKIWFWPICLHLEQQINLFQRGKNE